MPEARRLKPNVRAKRIREIRKQYLEGNTARLFKLSSWITFMDGERVVKRAAAPFARVDVRGKNILIYYEPLKIELKPTHAEIEVRDYDGGVLGSQILPVPPEFIPNVHTLAYHSVLGEKY